MTDTNSHNSLWDSLLDYVRGEADPAEVARVEARLASDPAFARERDRLAAMLAVVKTAHEPLLGADDDWGAAARVAARVRDRVLREEDQAARGARAPKPSRTLRWARLLAVSIGVHVIALGVLGWQIRQTELAQRPVGPESSFPVVENGSGGGAPFADETNPFGAPEGEFRFDTHLRIEDFIPADDLAALHLPPGDLDVPLLAPDPSLDQFLPSMRRAMRCRTSEEFKRLALLHAGSSNPDSLLQRLRQGLRFLSDTQRPDGSIGADDPGSAVRLTALALLPFLGDGHSARTDERGVVVDRAIEWLRVHAKAEKSASARAIALYALTEDYMLSNGVMTPAESVQRGGEIKALAGTLAAAPGSGMDAVWAPLAMAAVARTGLVSAGPAGDRSKRWAGEYLASAIPAEYSEPVTDPKDEVLRGLALLLAPKSKAAGFPAYPAWNAQALKASLSMLGVDGGIVRRLAPTDAERVEATALVLLTLELAYRTY